MFGKNKSALIKAMGQLQDADYAKNPELDGIYHRLLQGREQFEEAFAKDLSAVMQISSLDLAMKHHTEHMMELSDDVAESAGVIFEVAKETAGVASQVNSQHEELTNTIIDASEQTEEVYKKIESGQGELTNIKQLSSQTIQVSQEMKKDMDELFDVINRMYEVIAGINAISAQTNLLALNASIEAARAGDAGRGFAVVADEIRELAEETQKLTGNMGEFVEGIKNASQKSAESAASTIEALGTMTDKIENVWTINDENQKHVSKVNDSISALAAVSEEISSSMTELESQSANIKGQCDQLKDSSSVMRQVCKDMQAVIKPIGEIENVLDDGARVMGKMTDDPFFRMEAKVFAKHIKGAIEAHRGWLANLKNMVDRRTVLPIQLNSAKCGFGHFYYAMTPKTKEVRPIWDGIEEKHKKFHSYGSEVEKALFAEDYEKAEKLYKEAENYSRDLIADLEKMVAIAER